MLAFYEYDFDYSTAMLSLQSAQYGAMSLSFKAATKREVDATLKKQRKAVQEALQQKKAKDPISKVHLAHLLLPIIHMSQQDKTNVDTASDITAVLYGETVNAAIMALECDAETTATVSENSNETVIEMQGLKLESVGPEGEDRELFSIAILKHILASDIVEPMTEAEVDGMIEALKEDDLMTWQLTMELENDEAADEIVQEDQPEQQDTPAPAPATYEPAPSRKGKRKSADEVDEASQRPNKKRTTDQPTMAPCGALSQPPVSTRVKLQQQLEELKTNIPASQSRSGSVSPPAGANKRKRESADDPPMHVPSKKSKCDSRGTSSSMSQIIPSTSVTFDGKRGTVKFSDEGKELLLLRDDVVVYAISMNVPFEYEKGTCTNRLTVFQDKEKYQVTFNNGKDGRKQLDDYCVALEELASFDAGVDIAAAGSASPALQNEAEGLSEPGAGDAIAPAEDKTISSSADQDGLSNIQQQAPSPIDSAYDGGTPVESKEPGSTAREAGSLNKTDEVIVIEDDDDDVVAGKTDDDSAGRPAAAAATSSTSRAPSSRSTTTRSTLPSGGSTPRASSNGTASSTPPSTGSTARSTTSSTGPDAETISTMVGHYHKIYLQKGAGESWPGTDRKILRKFCTGCGIPKKQQKNVTTCRENIAKWLVRHGHTQGSKREFTSRTRWQADGNSGVVTQGFGTVEDEELAQFNTLRDMSLGKYGADPTKDESRRGVGARYN